MWPEWKPFTRGEYALSYDPNAVTTDTETETETEPQPATAPESTPSKPPQPGTNR